MRGGVNGYNYIIFILAPSIVIITRPGTSFRILIYIQINNFGCLPSFFVFFIFVVHNSKFELVKYYTTGMQGRKKYRRLTITGGRNNV